MRRHTMNWTLAPVLVGLLLSLGGARARAQDGDERPWEAARRFASNGAGYVLAVSFGTDPLVYNEEFELSVWVLDPAGTSRPLRDVELSVDAGMPEHGHGMNRVPSLERRDDGGFDVDGMLFHMIGTWELYYDVTRGAITERAQETVELE